MHEGQRLSTYKQTAKASTTSTAATIGTTRATATTARTASSNTEARQAARRMKSAAAKAARVVAKAARAAALASMDVEAPHATTAPSPDTRKPIVSPSKTNDHDYRRAHAHLWPNASMSENAIARILAHRLHHASARALEHITHLPTTIHLRIHAPITH